MTINVAPGTCKVPTGTYPTSYNYFCAVDTTGGSNVTISTASGANPRIDYIVAYVNLSVTPVTTSPNNPNSMFLLADVNGTPAGSPVVPTLSQIQSKIGASNPYIILAQILVGTSVTQITSGNITDIRAWASVSDQNRNNPASFAAWANITTGLLASTPTKIAFGTEEFDDGNNFDNLVNNRFTVTIPGKYVVQAGYETTAGASGEYYQISVYKNGSVFKNGPSEVSQGTNLINVAINTPGIQMAIGDYFEIFGFQNSGGTKNVATGESNTYFGAYLLGSN